jgi:F-type H+-transporting ATPase subunit delta
MAQSKASKRYSRALFDLAQERGRLDQVFGDCRSLRELIAQSAEVEAFLENPLIATERRRVVLEKLFKERLDVLSFQFLLFLDEKDRLNLLAQICDYFEDFYYELKRILKVKVVSARALTAEHVAAISERLKVRFDREIDSQVSLDATLLGGFRVIVGDQVLDYSLQTQLLEFNQKVIHA